MNIISGIARGIILEAPKGNEVRPTSARARKSLFDSLRTFDGMIVVDLFSGIGALGLEAASRGAKEVFFVDNSQENCRFIEKNMQKVKAAGVTNYLEVLNCDAMKIHEVLSNKRKEIDMIFADPPYALSDLVTQELLNNEKFVDWVGNALFIFETPSEISRKPKIEKLNLWYIKNCRKLGQSVFYFLKVKGSEQQAATESFEC